MAGFKKLMQILPKNSGRNASGVITTRHQGGRQKDFTDRLTGHVTSGI